MSGKHKKLIAAAKDAVDAVANDTTVSRSQTRESLELLREQINEAISALISFDD